jgi:hypothetical protein
MLQDTVLRSLVRLQLFSYFVSPVLSYYIVILLLFFFHDLCFADHNIFSSGYTITCMAICVSCILIHFHWGFVFRDSAAQKANGDYIVRAPGFSPTASPHLGAATLRAHRFKKTTMTITERYPIRQPKSVSNV